MLKLIDLLFQILTSNFCAEIAISIRSLQKSSVGKICKYPIDRICNSLLTIDRWQHAHDLVG